MTRRQRIHHHAQSRTVAAMVTRRRRTKRGEVYQPPSTTLTRSPHASPICMTISSSAMAECKRILAIHIYRSALLPALATAFVQFVSSTALCHQHFVPLPPSPFPLSFRLSLPLSLSRSPPWNSLAVARISPFLRLARVSPLFHQLSLPGCRFSLHIAASPSHPSGVVAKVQWKRP